MGGQVRTMWHAHIVKYAYRIHVRRTYICVNLVDACTHYVRTHDISSRVPASERMSVGVGWRASASRWGREEHTGDVILTKGRNNIGVDLLKSRLFLARVPPNALPFWYFERPSRNRVDFSTEPFMDKSLI